MLVEVTAAEVLPALKRNLKRTCLAPVAAAALVGFHCYHEHEKDQKIIKQKD